MVLKIWPFTFMLILIIQFSGVVYGQYPGAVGEGGVTVDGVFYGEGTAVGAKDNNLLIGGINQLGSFKLDNGETYYINPDNLPDFNPEYKKFANNNKAIYVPTYYSGDATGDAIALIEDAANVDLAAKSKASEQNGLLSPALKDQQYDTIIAYSGGTTSAVAALNKQALNKKDGVTCNTLILISPMKGELSDKEYKQEIDLILREGTVKNIVVLWSPKDKPTGNFLGYQAKPSLFAGDSRIAVKEVPLTKTGNDGHIEMFFTYANDNIKEGAYVEPKGQSTAKANQLSGFKPNDRPDIWNSGNLWDEKWKTKGSGSVGRPAVGQQQGQQQPSAYQQDTQGMSDEEKVQEFKRRLEEWFASGGAEAMQDQMQ